MQALEKARDELPEAYRSRTLLLDLDCSLAESATTYVDQTIDRFGKLDISVQCAGICPEGKPILETSEEEFDRVMAINVKGVWLGCKESLTGMKKQEGKGTGDKNILIISSQIGLDGEYAFLLFAYE